MSTGFRATSLMRESMIPPFSATPMSEKTRNRWGEEDNEDDDDEDDDGEAESILLG